MQMNTISSCPIQSFAYIMLCDIRSGITRIYKYVVIAKSDFLAVNFRMVKGIKKMDIGHWEPPRVSEKMRSVNLEESISGEYGTLSGHCG